jgi:UDP-N-acetylmuramyl pentapeptide phosphotransferase/UDP-N-acetylglucosamine-1-phosphate transferase
MKNIHIVAIALSLAAAVLVVLPTRTPALLLGTFALSLLMTGQAIPNIFAISYRKKLYDQPEDRRIHKTPTPRLGGLVFLPVICCSVILAVSLQAVLSPGVTLPSIGSVIWICPLTIIYMTGVIDDLIGVRPFIKLSAQILAGVLLVWSGLWIDDLGGLAGVHSLPVWVGRPLTVMFVVLVINAANLIDGVDGLAAGLCGLAFAIYGVWSYVAGEMLFAFISAAALGTLTPFFYANVRGLGPRRHKLFMGDTGSQTIGFVISIMAVGLIMRGSGDGLPVRMDIVSALSPLIVPVFDLVHVAVSRLLDGRHPFAPDKTHIHHRLMGCGLGGRPTVAIILGLSLGYTALNAALSRVAGPTIILVVDAALWGVFNAKLMYTKNRQSTQSSQTVQTTNFN